MYVNNYHTIENWLLAFRQKREQDNDGEAFFRLNEHLKEVTLHGNKHKMISSNFPLLSGMICMIRARQVQRHLQNGSDIDITGQRK